MNNDLKPMSNAERQRAHRQRVKDRLAGLPPVPSAPAQKKAPPKQTRPKRLALIEAELTALRDEYQGWLDAMPANLAEGENATRLQETIERLENALDEIEAIDPPRVGR